METAIWFMDKSSDAMWLLNPQGDVYYENSAAKACPRDPEWIPLNVPGLTEGFTLIQGTSSGEHVKRLEYLLESASPGLALYKLDVEKRESRPLIRTQNYLEKMKLKAEDVDMDGLLAVGKRIVASDREWLDPQIEESLRNLTTYVCDCNISHDEGVSRVQAKGRFQLVEGEILCTVGVEDFEDGFRERRIAEQALATSASLACLMDQLFDVQFYVDETLKIITGTRSHKLVDFFQGDVPLSLHDVVADSESATKLVKYLATRPVFCRTQLDREPRSEPPSLITIYFRSGDQVQVFAASAFLDSPNGCSNNCETPRLISSLVGNSAPEPNSIDRMHKRFLVALRRSQKSQPQPKRSLPEVCLDSPAKIQTPPDVIRPVVSLVFGRSLRGLIMDSLAVIASGRDQLPPLKNKTAGFPPVGLIAPTFSPRNVPWCLEELVLVLPGDLQTAVAALVRDGESVSVTDAITVLGPLIADPDLGRSVLATHLLMGLATRQAKDLDRLASLRSLHALLEKNLVPSLRSHGYRPLHVQVSLEFATLLVKEAASSPTLYGGGPNLAWVRAVVLEALEEPLRNHGNETETLPIMPAVFFLTILFADYCFKSGRDDEARELLTSAVDDMDAFLEQRCPELASVKQLLVIANHNLAIDALKRTDMLGAFNYILRLRTFRSLPPAAKKLVDWAVTFAI
jgi:hypothetical protein